MKAELWTTSYCPFCVAAVQLLEARGIEYTNHVMDSDAAGLRAKKQEYGHRTVPIILIDDEFLGGSDELRALDGQGRLVAS